MTRVAIAFSSKDRVDLTRRTIEPLLQPDKFTLLWCDGSNTPEGQDFFTNHASGNAMKREVRGGSCRYIVYALTTLLALGVDYVGLCENDVLLDPDWFEPTMALFEQGKADGLEVGAVSARNYEDRVLIQRDGYSINHNLGAGMVIFSRQAAEIILQTYRTGWTSENRKIFSILSGIDIGSFWAFKGGEHMLCADWAWDHILAAHGMCSLALTPAKATQLEDIAAMGLKMVAAPMQSRVDQHAYETFRERSARIRAGGLTLPVQAGDRLYHDGAHVIFPHQIAQLGGYYEGDWHFKWSMGYGCFAWKAGLSMQDDACSTQSFAGSSPAAHIPVFGPVDVLVSGGERGGRMQVEDYYSGYVCSPNLQPEGNEGHVLQIAIPGGFNYRTIRVTALTPGVVFYGIRTREAQCLLQPSTFSFNDLPPL